jgi:signal transduction histidine kinase
MSMQLFDTQGNILEHYGPVGIPKLFDSKSEVSANGLTLRLRQCKLVRSGELVGFLQLQLPVDKRNKATQEFLLTMIVMSPFVLLTFGVCSFVVAGIAARPIEELVVALRRFVADAGHELNTPASIVQARSQSLSRKLGNQDFGQEDLAIIASSAERMGCIVQDLMLLAELDAHCERRQSALELPELVQAIIGEYRDQFLHANRTLIYEGSASVAVIADKESIEKILRNLLDNALKYTLSEGTVKVTCELSGSEAVLIVADTGIGIPQDSLPRIFERFYRVDGSRARASGGSGLGLSIVKAIAESLGGRVQVSSELGKGSKFSVFLPARKAGIAQKLHTS